MYRPQILHSASEHGFATSEPGPPSPVPTKQINSSSSFPTRVHLKREMVSYRPAVGPAILRNSLAHRGLPLLAPFAQLPRRTIGLHVTFMDEMQRSATRLVLRLAAIRVAQDGFILSRIYCARSSLFIDRLALSIDSFAQLEDDSCDELLRQLLPTPTLMLDLASPMQRHSLHSLRWHRV